MAQNKVDAADAPYNYEARQNIADREGNARLVLPKHDPQHPFASVTK